MHTKTLGRIVLSFQVSLFVLALGASAVAGPPRVFILDGNQLNAVRERIQKGNPELAPALAELEQDAKRELTAGPFSVMNKKAVPPSGDKHDYMSLAPYFWPNPNTSNGLPYINRDGQRNPEIYEIPNRIDLGEMADDAETLSLAWYFTTNETYAAKAAGLLRAWFLNPATLMNPNLEYGQAIRGVNTGRGIGIIETRSLMRVVDCAGLLAGSQAWSPADQEGLEKWFDRYLQWMLDSKHGHDEAATKNNHGTYYDAQVADYAFFVGKNELAAGILQTVGTNRIAVQVEPDGREPLELKRTRAWSYSIANLAGLMSLARLGEHANVDLWHYETPDGRSIRKALDYLAPFGVGGTKWSYQQIDGWSADLFYPVLRLAAQKYPEGPYPELLSTIPAAPSASRGHLLLSSLEPVNHLHLRSTLQSKESE